MKRALLVALSLLGCGSGGATGDARPNLVLVIGDDQGYADLGFMGSPVARTPNLDRLAAEGTVFRFGYTTASICRPSMQTLLTGLYPSQYRARIPEVRRALRDDPIAQRVAGSVRGFDTLPRLLAARGYASFQSGKYWEGAYDWGGFTDGMSTQREARAGERIARETMQPVFAFVDAHLEQPFFLWFAPSLPHVPFDAPERYRRRYRDAQVPAGTLGYYANVSRFDDAVGELVAHLESRGLGERTLLVYVADNGWQAGELNRCCALQGGPKGKASLYEAGFRTPVVFHAPGRVAAGRQIDALVSTVDLFPTLLGYAGADPPPGRPGRDLRPLLEGRARAVRERVIGHMPSVRSDAVGTALRTGRPKKPGGFFLRARDWYFVDYLEQPDELYDMRADPEQGHDVVAAHPDRVHDFRREIAEWRTEFVPP